uniref:Uncharacterized protein n=1 Tax=Arundo donax TaxID=35708 RepID=A0A0A9DD00_ARUDO
MVGQHMFSLVGYNQLQNVADLLSTISQQRHLVELGAENRLPAERVQGDHHIYQRFQKRVEMCNLSSIQIRI